MRVVGQAIVTPHRPEWPKRLAGPAISTSLEVSKAVCREHRIDIGADFPVQVSVCHVADFQASVSPELMLNSQVVLPTIGHLVGRFAANAGSAVARPKAGVGRHVQAVEEAAVG